MSNARKSAFHISLPLAQLAARHALDEIERHTRCEFVPDVKGSLAKTLAGILANVELKGSLLTHGGMEKQMRNQLIAPPAKPSPRKRWRWPTANDEGVERQAHD